MNRCWKNERLPNDFCQFLRVFNFNGVEYSKMKDYIFYQIRLVSSLLMVK
eukprot:UN17142